MNPHYNQNYTREQINSVLAKIKECIRNNSFTIALNKNRQENIDFINEYNITGSKQKAILLDIRCEDFCHSLQNIRAGFEHEVLYVFAPRISLFNISGHKEKVSVYTKFSILDVPNGSYTVVISFHKTNKKVDYLNLERRTDYE